MRDTEIGSDLGNRCTLGYAVQLDCIPAELFGVILSCHRVGSSRFPRLKSGIKRVQHAGSRPYLGAFVPARLAGQIAKQSKHVYVCVRLEDQWLRCDPSDDWALSIASHHINPQCSPVVWNGRHDALLNLDPRHIVNECFPLADIDELMSWSMRLRMQIPVRIGNYFIEFLREQGSSIQSPEQVEERFDDWIHEAHPVWRRLYRMLPVRG